MRFMGLRADRIKTPYNAVSIERVRSLSGSPPAPNGVPFRDRHFTIVARIVVKKNVSMALKAMADYARQVESRDTCMFSVQALSRLNCVAGTESKGSRTLLVFADFYRRQRFAKPMGLRLRSFCPASRSNSEMSYPKHWQWVCRRYCLTIAEAGIPWCATGVNGFVIEADNPIGTAYFMQLLSEDEALWQRMCIASQQFVEQADTERFAEAVEALISTNKQ